jgi:ATP-dependent helicase/nuclease subunit A
VYEAVKAELSKLRDAAKKVRARLEPDETATLQAAAQGLRYARLASEARGAYDDAKSHRGGLDFDDLLVKTRDLLRDHPEAVLDAAGAVEFVLVDEFQDTDPVQAEILRLLAGEAFAEGRLFVVGDFKQSIYRFRGARPKIFQDFRSAFPAAGRLDLTENFRSTTPVLDFVNALFADAFPGETPHLAAGPRALPAGDGPAVEFVWADEPAEDAKPRGRTIARELRRVEARWLARLVRTRLDEGWTVRDRKTGSVRQAHAGDVAFLFRAMTDVAPYEQALAAEGLDFHVVGGSAFYAQQEVQDLVNVLSVVEDPLDPVALAGALRSPFFGLSDDALFWLSAPGRGGLAERFLAADAEATDGLSPDDRRRAGRARELLGRWRGLKDRLPIAELVDRVLDESGYEPALLGEFLGDRKRANARKLVRLARRFDARGGFTLAHFVARLRADLREPPREEQAATTDEEGTSVRLMSIHQAKGLEFPIVVVPDLNRKQDADRSPVLLDPDLGPLVRLGKLAPEADPDDTGGSGQSHGWTMYQTAERAEDEAESIRLFYVATTRARDALILSAGGGPASRPASPAMRLLDERFDRQTGTCRARLPESWPSPSVRVTTERPAGPPAPRARPRRPALRAIAKIIRSPGGTGGSPTSELGLGTTGGRAASATRPVSPTPDTTSPPRPRPRWIDLDAARGLSPRAAALDRLIRAVLSDPTATRPGSLGDAARRAARRQSPVAQADLVEEAVRRLEPWLLGSFGERLARAKTLERGFAWTAAWPPDAPGATVVAGWADLLARDAQGVWSVVVVSPPGAPEPLERLRWALSAHAARAQGFTPIGPGWRIDLGEGRLRGEEDSTPEAIEAAFREALAAPGSETGTRPELSTRPR